MTAIDQDKDLASGDTASTVADKNFIESLKDAMRTGFLLLKTYLIGKNKFKTILVVNHRETEKERPKAPEWLATYSDQLLKKVLFFSIL